MSTATTPAAPSDIDRAFDLLRGVIGPDADPKEMFFLSHPGAPVSKSRARWNRKTGRTYTPKSTVTAEEALALRFKAALRGATLTGAVAIVAVFYRPNFQRIDADNLMKLMLDAATQARVWPDDCHVVAVAAVIALDMDNPRTAIAFCEVESDMDRSRRFTCRVCGIQFNRAGVAAVKHPPQFCSRECRYEGYRRTRLPRRCVQCEKIIDVPASQKYCSAECRSAARRVRLPDPDRRPKRTCRLCGGPVSRREYPHCAICYKIIRKTGRLPQPSQLPLLGDEQETP